MSDATSRPRASGMSGVSRAVKVRAYVATVLLTLLLVGVAYKAYALQVGHAAEFRASALRQHVHTVEIPAPRGAILDARGRPLAVSADAASVYANPREVVDVVATAERLGEILDLDAALLESRLAADRAFAWIERHVTPEEAGAVRAAGLAGVEITAEPRRWYPGQSSAGPLIGFAGVDGNGLDGIELRFDEQLTGERARFAALRDARGKTALADGVVEAVPGATVHLTLDRAIQSVADKALLTAIEEHKAKAGVVVVIDVHTGGVLAMSSWPTYDPNEPGDAVKRQARNRAVTDVFEIGSVMKVFTVAAALDAGVVRADEWWDVENGAWKVGSKMIRDVHHDPVLTTSGIIKRSSNVGAVKIGMRLGRERLYEALRRYGFGQRTGIELPMEEPGTVRNGNRWREIELATISFGYGLTVTPLQLAAALAALGDGGVWHTPHLVEKITDATGAVTYQPTIERRQMFEPRTAAQILPMLASVFDKGKKDAGTAANVVVEGFRAGGKSGTAHKIDPATKRYADKLYLSSFAGLAPIDDPRIAVVVVIDEPTGKAHYGGAVAGPVFGTIVSETLRYLGVPGDPLPNVDVDVDVDVNVNGNGNGNGNVNVAAPPIADLTPPPANAITIPDLRGMSIARALAAARAANLTLEITGSGRALNQDPAPGPAAPTSSIRVTFSSVASGMETGVSARSPSDAR